MSANSGRAIVGLSALAPAVVATAALAASSPAWKSAPSAVDMAAAYPAKARAAAIGGTVVLTCTIGRQGHPAACSVFSEPRGGYGFGAAARRVVEKLTTSDRGVQGQDAMVMVTFNPDVLTSGEVSITQPVWTAMPSLNDFQATFPNIANGVNSVRVVLSCIVRPEGALGDCAVASETPSGQGYGQGALALAAKFRVGPWSQDGQPTAGARLNLPIRYALTQVSGKD